MPQTRLSPWWHDYGPDGHHVFLKREDEGRFGMTCGKLRKFASILPWIKQMGATRVAIIGSGNSNHVLAAAILLREHGITPIPLLKKSHTAGTNQFLLSLVVPQADWHWISNSDWQSVEQMAKSLVSTWAAAGITSCYLPEGGSLPEALPGAMTLADDIALHAQTMPPLTDIYIDAGTGLSAAALLIGMQKHEIQARLHVTLMADSESVFYNKLEQYFQWHARFAERPRPNLRDRLVLHRPAIAASYGAVNAEVLSHIARLAKFGILSDPIYTAKHLVTVERDLAQCSDRRVAIVIHSGGAQALPGYAHLFPTASPQSSPPRQ